jgi:hypothetical protein
LFKLFKRPRPTCLVLLIESVNVSSIARVSTDLFVILLQSGKILTGFGELTLFHTLTDVPVNEGTLGVHEIELVVNTGESLGDGSGVGNHTDSPLDLSQVTSRDTHRRLVVDSTLETSRAPVDELNGALGLDGGNGGVDVLGDDISTVHETASHVLSVAGVALSHHVGGLKDRAGDLSDRQRLVESLLSRDDRGVRSKHKVDTGVGYQVGLELGDIHVQSTIETEGGSERTDDLSNQTIQVGVSRPLNIEVATADIVKSFVVKAESAVSVLQKGVGREHRVVRLDNGSRDLRTGGDSEGELGLAAIVDRETLQKKRSKTGTSTSSSGVEDEETLKTSTVVSKLADAVQDKVNNFLSDGVVTTGVVVGGIFLSRDDLLGVVKLGVGSGADFVTDGGLKIDVDSTGDVLSRRSLAEEGVEGVVSNANGMVGRHVTIGADAVLEAVQLPAVVTDLDTGLTQMDGDTFCFQRVRRRRGLEPDHCQETLKKVRTWPQY